MRVLSILVTRCLPALRPSGSAELDSGVARRPRALPGGRQPDLAVTDSLLSAAGRGDVAALAAFYDRTAPIVFGLIRGVLGDAVIAERATERVYLRMWRSAPVFDARARSAHAALLLAARREVAAHLWLRIRGSASTGSVVDG